MGPKRVDQQPPAAKYLGLGNLTWKNEGPHNVSPHIVADNLEMVLNDNRNAFIGFSVGKISRDHNVILPPVHRHHGHARKVLVHLQDVDHQWDALQHNRVMNSVADIAIGCHTLLVADLAPSGTPRDIGSCVSLVSGKETYASDRA